MSDLTPQTSGLEKANGSENKPVSEATVSVIQPRTSFQEVKTRTPNQENTIPQEHQPPAKQLEEQITPAKTKKDEPQHIQLKTMSNVHSAEDDSDDESQPTEAKERVSLTMPRMQVGRFSVEEANFAQKLMHEPRNYLKQCFMFLFLTINCLGIVYGDIGTSPLYVFTSLFLPKVEQHLEINEIDILGATSLVLYSIISIITIKYIIFVMEASNDGEGGVFALSALLTDKPHKRNYTKNGLNPTLEKPPSILYKIYKHTVIIVAIIGAAFILGDGAITPPISVLSAIEGIKAVAPNMEPAVVPITCAILFLLFVVQRFGTAKVGIAFGPITFIWCIALLGVGIYNVSQNPSVFRAFNPAYIIYFFSTNGYNGFKMFGSVVLAITGVEAMYADMGHFGKGPIRVSWLFIVFPALCFCYLGQAAYFLQHHDAVDNVFFKSVPGPVYWPVFVLATLATTIASQAMITGAFSLINQAINLQYFPRIKVHQTSRNVEGQVYIPSVNIAYMIITISLVIIFKTSAALADAYGLAVCIVIFLTNLLYIVVVLVAWKRHMVFRLLVAIPFIVIYVPLSGVFVAANVLKFMTGGWIPLVIGVIATAIMMVWKYGDDKVRKMARAASVSAVPFDAFHKEIGDKVAIIPNHAGVFLTTKTNITIPTYLKDFGKVLSALPEIIILLSVKCYKTPVISEADRLIVQKVGPKMYRVHMRYGFFESKVDAHKFIIEKAAIPELATQIPLYYYMPRQRLTINRDYWFFKRWPALIFVFMHMNARAKTSNLKMPPETVIDVGTVVEI